MSILQIELPDEQLQIINEQARAQGYEDSGKYLAFVAEKLARQNGDSGAYNPSPEQLKREERLLLEAADSPRTESSPGLWAQMRAELEAKVGEKN